MGPNIIQQESRMRSIPDEALREMLMRMSAQPDKMGTPEFLLVAGEIQSRKDARAKAMAGQGNPTPVIADLLTGGAMPPQMQPQIPMLPENAGGVAALPAPNMDNVAEMAAGGIVAFSDGGRTLTRRGYRGAPEEEDLAEEIQRRLTRRGARPSLTPAAAAPLAAPIAAAEPAVAAPAGIEALGQTQAAPAVPPAPTVREINPPAPAAAAPTLSYADAFNQAQGFAKKLLPDLPAEEAVDPKTMIQDRNKLYKDLGIADPTSMRREQLESEIKNAKSEKEQAGWMRLAEFGFNWASQNGPALQAAAKAGAAVAPGLISDLKDLRKIERDQQKELAGLAALDAQAQRATADSVLAEIQKQRERRETRIENLETRRATVAASVAGNVISAGTQREVAGMQASALKDERDLARKDKRAQVALDSAEQAARDILDPVERTNAIKRYFRAFYDVAYGEGATAPARAQGRVVNGVYVPAGQ
jgi:hypothetical protein